MNKKSPKKTAAPEDNSTPAKSTKTVTVSQSSTPRRKPSQLRAYFSLTKYVFLAQTRNIATFAFGFLFPIVFISIFGLIGNNSQKVTVGIPKNTNKNNPVVAVLKKQNFVTIAEDSKTNLEQKLTQGKIGGIVTTTFSPNDFPYYTVQVETSTANPQQGASVTSLVRGVVDQSNLRMVGIRQAPIKLTQKEVSGREYRYIDFALPGQIGFSLLSTAIFGTVFGFIFLKKSLVLKRLFATPTLPLTFLLAQGTSRLIFALLQTLVILGFGILVFKFYLPFGWTTFAELMLLSTLGLIAFLGFGFFLAGLVNDENSAGPLINLVTLPQFLLSGTFFPTDSLPTWVQPIANNLPLAYFNEAVRKITIEGQHLSSIGADLLGLSLWGLAMYLLAAWTFKWE